MLQETVQKIHNRLSDYPSIFRWEIGEQTQHVVLFFDLGNMAILPFAGTYRTNYMATTRGADLKSCVCVFSLVYVFVLGLGWNMDVAENGLYTSLHQNSHSFKIVKGKLMTGGTMGIPFLLGPSPPWHIAQVTARYQSKQSKNPPALLQQACLVCLGGAG